MYFISISQLVSHSSTTALIVVSLTPCSLHVKQDCKARIVHVGWIEQQLFRTSFIRIPWNRWFLKSHPFALVLPSKLETCQQRQRSLATASQKRTEIKYRNSDSIFSITEQLKKHLPWYRGIFFATAGNFVIYINTFGISHTYEVEFEQSISWLAWKRRKKRDEFYLFSTVHLQQQRTLSKRQRVKPMMLEVIPTLGILREN